MTISFARCFDHPYPAWYDLDNTAQRDITHAIKEPRSPSVLEACGASALLPRYIEGTLPAREQAVVESGLQILRPILLTPASSRAVAMEGSVVDAKELALALNSAPRRAKFVHCP